MAMTSLRGFRLATENRFATNFNQLLPYMFDVKLGLTKAAPSERSVVLVIYYLVNAAYFLRYNQPFIMDAYTKYFT